MTEVNVKDLQLQDELPPKKLSGNAVSKIEKLLDVLEQHPGKWAIVNKNVSPSYISRYRGRYQSFEFAARSPEGYPKGKADIWARFRGTQYALDNLAKQRQKAAQKATLDGPPAAHGADTVGGRQ